MKRLGLDLGSSSIGWALREDDDIIANGVITFDAGMQKGQTGGYTSPTKDRRVARSKRRLIQARKYRKFELLKILLGEYAPLDKAELEKWSKYKKGEVQMFPENVKFQKWLASDFTYEGGVKYNNPYELRIKALDEKLSKHEFGRALYHLVQRRGYKNIGEADDETKKQIERRGTSGFQTALDNNRTIAEALKKEFLDKGERARNQYPYRGEYQNEFEEICKGQGFDTLKNEKGELTNEFVQCLWKAIIWQRPLKSQKGNIGKCTLEPTKSRCPVSHPVFEVFRALSFINTIKYSANTNDEKVFLSPELRNILFYGFFLNKDKNFKFEEIRNFIDKQLKSKNYYNYPYNNKENIYDSSVAGMPVCKGLISVFGNDTKKAIADIHKYHIGNAPELKNGYSIYDLWHILFSFDDKTATNKKFLEIFAIEKLGIQNEIKKEKEYNPFANLKGLIATSYSDLSLKAICKIIPFLIEGYLYNEAVVLAKMPELLGDNWEAEQYKIKEYIKKANELYSKNKRNTGIVNNLIDKYKGLEFVEKFAHKDFNYRLSESDYKEVEEICKSYFGEYTWSKRNDKLEIVESVKEQYQAFFNDNKRVYREVPLFTDILKELLKENNIEFNGKLYHHSNRENLYLKKVKDPKSLESLPPAMIDSIKNPMFNKSLSILRKLINELIRTNKIDNDTELVVEVARELNDNNKRAAIERFQKFRRDNRERYRQFLEEFKEQKDKSINVEESISKFELWAEQTFEETLNEKKEFIKNKSNSEIHQEKNALKRYELWMEQKGQCMYTGKMISITQLFSNEIDIEHTIPRSILPDNTMANQTVCYAWYNRDKKKKQLPRHCANYSEDVEGFGSAIEARLDRWMTIRDNFKEQYEKRLKPFGGEDEATKNKRIQEKHYYKMHFDYWNDKLNRFTADEVKDSWARRQLVDTQMVSKYAREYLKTYFKKVTVQKGEVTADFRKIFGFQEQDEIKGRNKHTHHSIDAAVLTLIPINSSYRERMLKKMYETYENERKQFTSQPYSDFDSQKLINEIENKTLIVNFKKDNLLKETIKIVRNRGKIQYVKNKKGEFILDKNGEKIIKVAKGDAVRSTLFAQTYLGKIKNVERYPDGQPIREGEDWKYKKGKDEFAFVIRKSLKDAISNVDDIVDPIIKEIVRKQKENAIDPQGKKIRHVRIFTKAGQVVKERLNYRSDKDYKNKFYSTAGSLPYAILLQNSIKGRLERELIPIASYEVAKYYKKNGTFDINMFVEENYSEYKGWADKKLLKVGQNIIVLREDKENELINNIDFQKKRMYVIEKFSDGSIWLIYHLEADPDNIEDSVKQIKDGYIKEFEIKYNLPEIQPDLSIQNKNEQNKDFLKRKFSFNSINDYRPSRLVPFLGEKVVKEILKNLKHNYAARPSKISNLGQPSLLKMSNENWNFLYEGEDFKLSILGEFNLLKLWKNI